LDIWVTLTVATREAEVNISLGWFCLLGGALGAFRVATAKKFYKSDFANQEGVITEEERKTEVTLTPLMRWMIVAVCIAVAIYGGIRIQDDHAWNPFSNGGPPVLTR
jgi:hypothetical protein